MNFKDLEHIANKQTHKTAVSKQSNFDSLLKRGLSFLSRAHNEGFRHAETLLKSCDLLIDSIALNRNDTRPYLALAYLFSILENFKTAEEYAYAALKLEPNNNELAAFVDTIIAFKKETHQEKTAHQALSFKLDLPSSVSGNKTSTRPNYRELYQELEVFILEKLKGLFSSNHQQVEPTVDRKRYKLIEQSLKSLNEVTTYIEQQLTVIEQGLNASKLREKTAPFKMLEERYSQSLKKSKILMEIDDTIELWNFKTDKQMQVVNQKLTMSALTYGRVDVERMMDGCDLIADQLDHLSEAGEVDISLVESSYEKLLGLVENLNGMVDNSGVVQQNKNKLADILA